MSKNTVAVELRTEDLSYLIDFLVEELRVWNDKGFESREEEEQFHRIVGVVGKLRKAMGVCATLFL